MIVKLPAILEFEIVTQGLGDVGIQRPAVGYLWFGEGTVSQRPVGLEQLNHSADRVSPRIGGVVPGAVFHDRPVQKLAAGSWL